jgi:hypothetical protein
MTEGKDMNRRFKLAAVVLGSVLAMCAGEAHAQLMGHNQLGDFGLQAGTQPPPGFYLVAPLYSRYEADTLRNGLGNRSPAQTDVSVNAYVVGLSWVSNVKVLGANYSFQIFPGFTDNVLEAPVLGVSQRVDTGFTDLYFQPINLGWHTDRADFVAGLGVFAPTGRYELGADDNLGLGMWSFEVFGGTTVYFDEAKSWHLATTAFYETHTEKEGSDVKVGDILTFEGGLGKSFMQGMTNVGIAYYAQFKVTDDDFGTNLSLPPALLPAKHLGFGVGPEVSFPMASKQRLYGFLNFRYYWETGVRNSLEGNTFVFTASFPIPSVSLQ